ncbi:IX farnesyltransferase [Seminavis robusta]|uniref:Heme O synthase n=1 Tax=Seminavis robusta TaxID=568900 RepID=A0A9N8D9V6_9STRA|nr:IX farnesyltransferase [Seminavis robusta]|eukprot:Sro11_g008640.1 IX farnesyltransferase (449) ;mRNA; r:106092-107438
MTSSLLLRRSLAASSSSRVLRTSAYRRLVGHEERLVVRFSASSTTTTSTTSTDVAVEKSETTKSTSKSKAYADLAKARLSALVVATTGCGFLAAGGPFSAGVLSSCVVGTALCSSSAAAWNQILEVDRDKRMKRTQQRPLVQDTLTMGQAQTAATLWGVGGVSLLYVGTDPTTALLGASNILLYSGLYTWMKPRTIYNTWVGAVVGAIPPVMGWTAATGGSLLDIEAMLLGSTLFLWQMPHFFALSFMHRQDYARGGFAMVPVVEEQREANGNTDYSHTASLITRYAAYLSAIPFVSTLTGVTSSMFALEGLALNAYALHVAHKFSRDRTNANARKVFLTSLWYLPSFMMLFLLHNRVWDEEENTQKDAVREWISAQVHVVREMGRQVCIHEKAIMKQEDAHVPAEVTKLACPVALGQQKSREGVQVLQRRASQVAAVATASSTSSET